MDLGVLDTLETLVDELEIAVSADELTRLFRLRERLLAKAMRPLREFNEGQLYQLSKAASTKQFLERTVGLSARDAGATASLARRLGAMAVTEAAWLDGSLVSGQVR